MLNERSIQQLTGILSGLSLWVLMSLGLSSCQSQPAEALPAEPVSTDVRGTSPRGMELPFETIAQETFGAYRDPTPSNPYPFEDNSLAMLIIARPDDAAAVEHRITLTAKQRLQMLDYTGFLALGVFGGWKPSTGYGVEVERIMREGNIVTVFATVHGPNLDEAKAQTESSPYHLVRVRKVGDWEQGITFNLVVEGAIVASRTYAAPPAAALQNVTPSGTELPFGTIEQEEFGLTERFSPDEPYPFADDAPALMIIARPEELAAVEQRLTAKGKAGLQRLDYATSFALVVFQGYKPSSGYSTQVERITRKEDIVTVSTTFREPTPEEEKLAVVTLPYHLIQVRKSGNWEQNVTFNVVVDGAVVASISHFIP